MPKQSAAVCLAVAILAACGDARASAQGGPRADVEFSLNASSPEQRTAIAIALWKTRAVSNVSSAEGGGQPYRVYLKDRGNLLLTSQVHRVLEEQSGVLEVSSLAGYMGTTD